MDDALEDVLHEIKKAGEGIGDEAKATLTHTARRFKETARTFIHEARAQSRELSQEATNQVKAHPLAAATAAAAALVLIGLALRHRPQHAG
jgi:ElaB/YqjD/DUF883 family membrane-anchored ribosome-binding protein